MLKVPAVQKTTEAWLKETEWWVVKGTTGSGKTYFVEQLKHIIFANRWPVVYVPQFPMFKPMLKVKHFVRLLPLSCAARKDLVADLEQLGVPTNGLIGGKLMGMLDIPGLSGGERKKMLIAVSVAVAIQFQCPFIVMDEPFAGVDGSGMGDIIRVMERASKEVPGLKYIIVTHDHFSKLPPSASLIEVKDRRVSGQDGEYEEDNSVAAAVFAASMLSNAAARPKRRPMFDLYLVKRYFVEQEFGVPMMGSMLFALALGLAAVNVSVPLPGTFVNKDGLYVFMKILLFEYPHLGGLINYCFKRGQHMEDVYLNITASQFGVAETFVITVLQMVSIIAIATAIMCGISDFWWLGFDVVWIDLLYAVMTTTGFLLYPIIVPNPLVAALLMLPYLSCTVILSMMLTPREDAWPGIKWLTIMSGPYHVGCAYSKVSDKIDLPRVECTSLVFHMFMLNPWFYVVVFGVALKMILAGLAVRKLRIDVPSRGATEPATKASTKTVVKPSGETQERQHEAPRAPASSAATPEKKEVDVKEWLGSNKWWIVQGRTGSGKTYFAERLTKCLYDLGREVVFVPQFPMYRPQLTVQRFLGLLPLKEELRKELMESLTEMEVPTSGLVGGMFAGMLNIKGLSGGQRKKLLIAVTVAIVGNFGCTHVVMDEPFAGINEGSMEVVKKVLDKAHKRVPDVKFFIVTHDHIESVSESAIVLTVEDRQVVGSNGYVNGNVEAAADIAKGWVAAVAAPTSRRPFIDLNIVKRHFVEQEWLLPLATYIIFGCLLGCTMTEYTGDLPGFGLDVIYVFLKIFVIEYPNFSSLISLCYKRAQHLEDYGLGIMASRYGVVELFIAAALQQIVSVIILDALLCGIDNFWWINANVVLIDIFYAIVSTAGYYMIPIVIPNPIVVMATNFPYVIVWGFFNGILLPRSDLWDPIEWMPVFSPMYNVGCAYTFVSDKKIRLLGTECYDSLALHLVFISSLFWVFGIALGIKLLLELRRSRALKAEATNPKAELGSRVSL